MKAMLSNKPYLLEAFYKWIVDSECTPLLTVNANDKRSIVPKEYIEDGEIILNIAPEAVRDFKITSKHIEFSASFSQVVNFIFIPIRAIRAIFAEEDNAKGMYFEEDLLDEWEDEDLPSEKGKKPPYLTLIK